MPYSVKLASDENDVPIMNRNKIRHKRAKLTPMIVATAISPLVW